ncbi:glycosyltransferase family 2 protein [Corynebacterium halotolerans]|uniref:Rhamnosyl transferase WbbL n=1 Tax=Corynebacterium halotolerans YIM 70093 = DSM 44683 TaxID=1121362 RepID=M1NQF3_9CORY|nr:glycosyltransferase family 2 protein [Corynebacterium halotolerans]AGF71742.1 rhamnosyl transferase WbbL [Corynebacterium halotolerans YIM 70093 = DSM 44683]
MSTSSVAATAPVAVVTVTYSPGRHLATFLDSLAAATDRETAVVLADNGSTDGVPEAEAARRGGVEFLPTGGNLGYGSGVNAAVRHLRGRREAGEIDGEFFVISNPDVVFGPGSIDALIACARRWPDAAAVGPRIDEADGTTYPSARAVPTLGNGIGHALLGTVWPSNPWTRAYRDNADMDHERTAGWLSGSCLLVRWDAFEAIGGFDERYFMYMEDVDLGDRFTRAGHVNVYCANARITHAKGHAAGEVPELMLPAHHESAYRFQSDRLPHPWQAPVRLALRTGLKLRQIYAVSRARRDRG